MRELIVRRWESICRDGGEGKVDVFCVRGVEISCCGATIRSRDADIGVSSQIIEMG